MVKFLRGNSVASAFFMALKGHTRHISAAANSVQQVDMKVNDLLKIYLSIGVMSSKVHSQSSETTVVVEVTKTLDSENRKPKT